MSNQDFAVLSVRVPAAIRDQIRDLVKQNGFLNDSDWLRTAIRDYIINTLPKKEANNQ